MPGMHVMIVLSHKKAFITVMLTVFIHTDVFYYIMLLVLSYILVLDTLLQM